MGGDHLAHYSLGAAQFGDRRVEPEHHAVLGVGL